MPITHISQFETIETRTLITIMRTGEIFTDNRIISKFTMDDIEHAITAMRAVQQRFGPAELLIVHEWAFYFRITDVEQ